MFSLSLLALSAIIIVFSLFIGVSLYLMGVGIGVSLIITLSSMTHLMLLAVLTRVWLIERFPAVRNALERIPGVSFPVPVPEQLQRQAQRKQTGIPLSVTPVTPAAAPQTDTPPRIREPFTLGTLAFEPPEPIIPDHTPPPERASDVSSLELAWRKSRRGQAATPFDRLLKVCRALKQCNLEVNVWTEAELKTLADHMLGPDDDERRMAALLMPQNVVRLFHFRTGEAQHHASVFNAMLQVTELQMEVASVSSVKDPTSGECAVRFEYRGEPVCWRFIEPENRLSESFIQRALAWVSQQAAGEFRPLAKWEGQRQLIYLPRTAWQSIQKQPSGVI